MRILGNIIVFSLIIFFFGCSTLDSVGSSTIKPDYQTELSAKKVRDTFAIEQLINLVDLDIKPIAPLAPLVKRYKKAHPVLMQLYKEQAAAQYTGTVHVILNRHKQPVGEETNPTELKASQEQVLKILEQIQPDLLVAEGCTSVMDDNVCSSEDWEQNRRIAEFVRREPPNRDRFVEQSSAGKRMHGIYQYHQAHPEVPTTGMEHEDLVELQMMTHHGLVMVAPEQYGMINEVAIMARSEYALAKLIEASRKIGAKNPVLVIGAYHGSDLTTLAYYWGLKAKFYIAAPPGKKAEYTEMMLPRY